MLISLLEFNAEIMEHFEKDIDLFLYIPVPIVRISVVTANSDQSGLILSVQFMIFFLEWCKSHVILIMTYCLSCDPQIMIDRLFVFIVSMHLNPNSYPLIWIFNCIFV